MEKKSPHNRFFPQGGKRVLKCNLHVLYQILVYIICKLQLTYVYDLQSSVITSLVLGYRKHVKVTLSYAWLIITKMQLITPMK